MRKDTIIEIVHNMFYRYEYQGAGAKGNKPHVHIDATLDPEPEEISSASICYMSTSFATSLYGTGNERLKKIGVVADKREYDEWCTVF